MMLQALLASLLTAASISTFSGPPAQQWVNFDVQPPREEWSALARESACQELKRPTVTGLGLPVHVHLRVWVQQERSFTPQEFHQEVIRGCEDA